MLVIHRRIDPQPVWAAELHLTFDARSKSRLRCFSADGEDVGLFLERGQPPLYDGECLQAEDGRTVRVCARPEQLLHVTCANAFELTRAAYHLGNRHVPIELQPDHLKIEPDHVLADMLRAMHLIVNEQDLPFEPEGGAYAAGHGDGHDHGQKHDHGHSHDVGHDHAHEHQHDPASARARPVAIPVVAQGHVHGPHCNHDH